jgi:hypothetical protein
MIVSTQASSDEFRLRQPFMKFPHLSPTLMKAYLECKKEFFQSGKTRSVDAARHFFQKCYERKNIDLEAELAKQKDQLLGIAQTQ